jgi:hypothetical protein
VGAVKKLKMKTRPKSGDRRDVRCAFVLDRPGDHDLGARPSESWCFGCGYYVCDGCDSPEGVVGRHDVAEHSPEEDDDGTDV